MQWRRTGGNAGTNPRITQHQRPGQPIRRKLILHNSFYLLFYLIVRYLFIIPFTVMLFYNFPPPPPTAQQPPVGQGFLIIEVSRSHSDTPHSVELLPKSDQPDAVASTWQHTTHTRDRLLCPRWDSNPQSQQASGCRPTPLPARPPVSMFVAIC